jgi:hypothetical protein
MAVVGTIEPPILNPEHVNCPTPFLRVRERRLGGCVLDLHRIDQAMAGAKRGDQGPVGNCQFKFPEQNIPWSSEI